MNKVTRHSIWKLRDSYRQGVNFLPKITVLAIEKGKKCPINPMTEKCLTCLNRKPWKGMIVGSEDDTEDKYKLFDLRMFCLGSEAAFEKVSDGDLDEKEDKKSMLTWKSGKRKK